MRAIVFIGGEGPEPGDPERILGDFDVSIAADSGLSIAESWGIRCDWIVGDMDSLVDQASLGRYPAERIRRYRTDKDDTDTEIALSLAGELGCGESILVGGGGGRLDHLMAILALFERQDAPRRWVTRNEEVLLLDGDAGFGLFGSPVLKGSTVSVFPVGRGPWRIDSAGLKWPLSGLTWNRGRFGISNEAETGALSLNALEGRFLVTLPLGARSASGEGFR